MVRGPDRWLPSSALLSSAAIESAAIATKGPGVSVVGVECPDCEGGALVQGRPLSALLFHHEPVYPLADSVGSQLGG